MRFKSDPSLSKKDLRLHPQRGKKSLRIRVNFTWSIQVQQFFEKKSKTCYQSYWFAIFHPLRFLVGCQGTRFYCTAVAATCREVGSVMTAAMSITQHRLRHCCAIEGLHVFNGGIFPHPGTGVQLVLCCLDLCGENGEVFLCMNSL